MVSAVFKRMMLIAAIALSWLASTGTVLVLASRAPRGYEDARGCHFGITPAEQEYMDHAPVAIAAGPVHFHPHFPVTRSPLAADEG